MAWGGFEIFAKAHMCPFREAGAPHVSHFVEIAQRKHPAISNHRYPLPIGKSRSVKAIARAKSLVLEGKADGRFWHGWLQGDAAIVDAIHAAQLARVVRNLSAHGVLSPDLAIELNAVALCDALVNALVTIAGEVITGSVSQTKA